MKRLAVLALALALARPAAAGEAAPESEEAKTLYTLGHSMARGIAGLEMNEEQLRWVEQGLHDGVLGGPPKVPVESYGPKVNAFVRERLGAIGQREGKESDAFVAAQAKEAGAVRTDSGLVYRELRAGTGESPKATSRVKVHYHGTLRDGKVFDSSVERKTPATFALNQVIPCWTEGVQRMKVGGKSRLVCPAKLAYGERGAPPHIRPGAALVFEVELLGIEE